jgi:hypothetical protein
MLPDMVTRSGMVTRLGGSVVAVVRFCVRLCWLMTISCPRDQLFSQLNPIIASPDPVDGYGT